MKPLPLWVILTYCKIWHFCDNLELTIFLPTANWRLTEPLYAMGNLLAELQKIAAQSRWRSALLLLMSFWDIKKTRLRNNFDLNVHCPFLILQSVMVIPDPYESGSGNSPYGSKEKKSNLKFSTNNSTFQNNFFK